jgi:peptidoglycan/LPS O-acetylase OafA/YrhL
VLPQLDALRGVAILAVFTQHLGDRFMPFVEAEAARALPPALAVWALTVVHHAHWGVDLFFVLSGFSLAQGYLRAFSGGTRGAARASAPVGARTFFTHRAARILPAYYVALAVSLAFHPALARRDGFGAALAAHLAVLQGYVTPGGVAIIAATWSLTTEIGFYLLLPLLARPLLAPPLRRGLLVGAALCAFAWGSRAILHAATLEPGAHTALLEATQRRWISSRLDQFVLGAVAAALHARGFGGGSPHRDRCAQASRPERIARGAPFLLALAVGAIVVGFRLEGALYLVPGGSWPYAILSVATAGLVLAASLCRGSALRIAAPAPLRAVGVVSYGVFLYHQLAIGLAGAVLPGEGWGCLAANGVLALTLALAGGVASWVLVERPAIFWARGRGRVPGQGS